MAQPSRRPDHGVTRKRCERYKRKDPPEWKTKVSHNSQEDDATEKKSKRTDKIHQPTQLSRQGNAEAHQNGKGGGVIDRGPSNKMQGPVQACLAKDPPPLNYFGAMGEQDTQAIITNIFGGDDATALAFARGVISKENKTESGTTTGAAQGVPHQEDRKGAHQPETTLSTSTTKKSSWEVPNKETSSDCLSDD